MEYFLEYFRYLGIEHFASGDGVNRAAEDESWRHVTVVDAFNLDLDVLARGDGRDLDVVRPDLLHLDIGLKRQKLLWREKRHNNK